MEFECGPIDFRTNEGRVLLKKVRLKFSPPTLCVISGPSGAGKSTLLRAIAGLNKAMVGKRRLGEQTFGQGDLPRWRSLVTLLPQDAPCIQGSVRDNLTFPFGLKNSTVKAFPMERAVELLRKFGLSHIGMDRDIKELSGGERHRLALIRGLLWAPPVLLADEPLSGLDESMAQRCFGLLRAFSRERPSVVITVLHNQDVLKDADVCLRLEHGSLHRIECI